MPRDQGGTILVVDDNRDIRGLTSKFLEAVGYTVLSAADGEEELRFYEEHQSRIVLLLTDVTMPKLSGLELADRILAIDSRLPVLFMSGEVWNDHRGLGCVAKPFRSTELLASVTRALHPTTVSERTAPMGVTTDANLERQIL
jgi:CheY-like chemotaxis protein